MLRVCSVCGKRFIHNNLGEYLYKTNPKNPNTSVAIRAGRKPNNKIQQEEKTMKDNEIHRLLETAQATYGYGNQIAVAMEELSELGAILPKYLRYDFHDEAVAVLKDKVLEETADVVICLRHIQMIFGIQPDELEGMMDMKLNRLKRWLDNEDKSFHHTTEDRAVTNTCEGCYYWEHVSEDSPCRECQMFSRFTPYGMNPKGVN